MYVPLYARDRKKYTIKLKYEEESGMV